MREWYVIDKLTGRIVDCMMTANPEPTSPNPARFYLTEHPTQVQLEGYQYYWERP